LAGVGVKVTEVPAQMVEAEAAILTAGVTAAFTVMVTLFEVAVGELGQAAVDVITQDTTSELANEVLVNVAPVDEFTPFIFH
jgi:hypothetical protein